MSTTTINRKTRQYTDLDLAFTKAVNGDVAIKSDENAVKASLKNLILTINYERPFHPEIGCQINNLLFEPYDPVSEAVMEQTIYDVVAKFEPRVELLKVKISSTNDSNGVEATITFKLRNNPTPINLVTVLNRVR